MPNLLLKLPLQLFKLPSVNENFQSGGTQGDSFTFRAEVELQDKSENPTSSHYFLADFPNFGSQGHIQAGIMGIGEKVLGKDFCEEKPGSALCQIWKPNK